MEKEQYEVKILAEDFYSIFPRIREEHRNVAVTYVYADFPPATIVIDLYQIFKEDQFRAEDQIRKKEGTLYEKYVEERAKRIREDIKERIVRVPEEIIV